MEYPESERNLGKVNQQVNDLLQECRDIMACAKSSQEIRWKRLAGDHLDPMLQSRATAERYLTHEDANLRAVAISVLRHRWRPDSRLAVTCEMMTFDDPDLRVREAALLCLGACYAGTNDRRIGNEVARILMDEAAPPELRLTAYYDLFQIRGIPVNRSPTIRIATGRFGFPQEVDWSFVRGFLM